MTPSSIPWDCYVAAPYARAAEVRALHERLRALDIGVTSTWAEKAAGPDGAALLDDAGRAAAIQENDHGVTAADAMLVLAYPGEGGEMFCEMRRALEIPIPVVYVGARVILSAYRRGVARVGDVEAGIAEIARYAAHDRDPLTPEGGLRVRLRRRRQVLP